jgi:alpha-glucosidase (family GH31 glycosyl hydrolase)
MALRPTHLFLLALLATPAAAAELALSAGSLGVRVQTDPWRLRFVDAAGRAILTEAGAPAGPLGFRTDAGRVRATRALGTMSARDRLTAVVETDDAQGRSLEVDIGVDAEGVVALTMRVIGGSLADVVALGAGFEALPEERFFGFGERANALDQRGHVVESYVADGPYQEDELPLVALFVPPPGFRPRDDATYFPVPWLLSSRGFGVLVDNPEVSYFRLATDDPGQWSVEVVGAPEGEAPLPAPDALRLRVFAGPQPVDVLRRFTRHTGRQPAPVAPWVLGPWFQPGGDAAAEAAQVDKLRNADAPLSVAQTYVHYLPCGDQRADPGAGPALTAAMHARGVAVTTYFNPMICESYAPRFDQAVAAGALTRDSAGGALVYNYTGSTIFRVGQFDFTQPAGRQQYGKLLAEAVADGYDGWMEDFGEYAPLDAFAGAGLTGAAGHDLYPVQYHCGAWDFVRRLRRPVVRFQRSGWTGAAPCAQVVWGGDPSTTWGFDGLTSALWSGLGMGLSGVAVWGSDIGGFFALGDRQLTPEMLMRWVQLGVVSGVMRTERNGFSLPAHPRPQVDDDDQLPNWRRWAKLRTQLYPYISAALREYRRSGLPLMRHLLLVAPDDAAAIGRTDEFLFGPDILAAPVLEPDARLREVYLPDGAWVDLWRSGRYDSATGGFVMGEAAVIAGRRAVTLPAPLDELPLLIRAGAVLPLLPPDVDTLADYGAPAPGFVRLVDRRDRLELLAFPRGDTVARMFAGGEGLASREHADGWEFSIRGKLLRTYGLQASLATLERPFAPCAVEWNGRPLPASAWQWDGGTQVLRAEFTGARGRLRVRGCS